MAVPFLARTPSAHSRIEAAMEWFLCGCIDTPELPAARLRKGKLRSSALCSSMHFADAQV